MADLVVQPTKKFFLAGTIAAPLVFLALVNNHRVKWLDSSHEGWLLALWALIMIWTITQLVKYKMLKATITAKRLRYKKAGWVSVTTRTIQLAKVQDVRVDQRLTQRIFDVGNISIEIAGEASRLTLFNVDGPQALAGEILNRSQAASIAGPSAAGNP